MFAEAAPSNKQVPDLACASCCFIPYTSYQREIQTWHKMPQPCFNCSMPPCPSCARLFALTFLRCHAGSIKSRSGADLWKILFSRRHWAETQNSIPCLLDDLLAACSGSIQSCQKRPSGLTKTFLKYRCTDPGATEISLSSVRHFLQGTCLLALQQLKCSPANDHQNYYF